MILTDSSWENQIRGEFKKGYKNSECRFFQDKAIAEPVCRLLETTLRSTHLPSRMGALHGLLYVLECDLLDDTAKQLIPTISEYLLSNLRAIAQ